LPVAEAVLLFLQPNANAATIIKTVIVLFNMKVYLIL